jgi:hypothetical protein
MKPLMLIAIVAIIAVTVVVTYDLNGHSLDLRDRQVVLVVTDSMDGDEHSYEIDSFPANTLVMIQHLSEQEKHFLRVGDVASYRENGTLVQHRVVQVEDGYVYLHGDNNHSTERVMIEDIDGKVVGTNWVLGHILAFISSNFLAFLCILFAIGAVAVVYAVFSEGKKEVTAE